MIVLDASLAVDLLGESARGAAASAVLAGERVAVPAHFDVEVYGVFRRLFRRGLLDRDRLDRIAIRLISFAADRVALPALLPEAHRLADRLSVPDAFYVALARLRRLELVTADAHLAQAATSIAQVRLIA